MNTFACALVLAQVGADEPADPNRLSLGRPGAVTLKQGELFDLRQGRAASLADLVVQARTHRFVLLGESHDNAEHHRMQARVIEALVADGREVIVGLEMFTRPNQTNLNPWTLGWWTEEEFIERANWKQEWNMDFALYRPIFEAVRQHRLPMLALNVPRDWVRTASRQGYDSLPAEAKAQLPELVLGHQPHREVFKALMGGHPMGAQLENVYRGQVLWDEAMADTAIRYLEGRFGSVNATPARVVIVMIVGTGHGMYEAGINWRLKRRTGLETLTLSMVATEREITVSRGLGDFAYAAPLPPVSR